MRGVLIVALAALAGCATSQTSRTGSGTTRYRVGDYVVYHYEFAEAAPVTLREQVVEVDGNRLTFEVTATKRSLKNRWVQVVTDTPENQKNDVVDEVYDIVDGKRVRLTNKDNADLYRFYSWTLPPMGTGERTEVRTEKYKAEIVGTSYECLEEKGRIPSEMLSFEFSTCPDFLWTNGPAAVKSDDGEILWSRQVVEAGNVREPVRKVEQKPETPPADTAEQGDILP